MGVFPIRRFVGRSRGLDIRGRKITLPCRLVSAQRYDIGDHATEGLDEGVFSSGQALRVWTMAFYFPIHQMRRLIPWWNCASCCPERDVTIERTLMIVRRIGDLTTTVRDVGHAVVTQMML